MQVVRTLIWVVLTAVLVAFVAMNWHSAEVHFWPVGDGYLRFDWPVGFIALFFFALGFVPMWLRHRLHRWSAGRRIATLESSLHAAAPGPPLATSTQLEAEAEKD